MKEYQYQPHVLYILSKDYYCVGLCNIFYTQVPIFAREKKRHAISPEQSIPVSTRRRACNIRNTYVLKHNASNMK